MEALARAFEVSPRTLANWKRLDPDAPAARPGPRGASEEELERVRDLVREELATQGWDAGEGAVHAALPELSLWRVRQALRELKAERRRRVRVQRESERKSTRVRLRDAVWAIDATQLGRDASGRAVLAEVVRDVASTRTIGLSIGRAATERDVVMLLHQTARRRGRLPLVLMSDNAKAYVSGVVEAWLARRGVVHLRSLPRTPQHNAAVEHGMRELKEASGLGRGVCVSRGEAVVRLERARDQLDGARRRVTRGGRTAREHDALTPSWEARIDRWSFYDDTACAIREAVLRCRNTRDRRRAERDAILRVLESYRAIEMTRGGAASWGSIAEGNT